MKKIYVEYGENYEWKMTKYDKAYMDYITRKQLKDKPKSKYSILDWLNVEFEK